jgi:hypothetical protein
MRPIEEAGGELVTSGDGLTFVVDESDMSAVCRVGGQW